MTKKYTQFGQFIDELEKLASLGQELTVAKRLRKLRREDVPARMRLSTAILARRTGLPSLALRLLAPAVHPESRRIGGTPQERTIYAAALIRIGAVDEALALLSTVSDSDVAESLLFKAHAYISRWDYAPTIPILKRYVSASRDNPRQIIIGNLNLAAALLFEGFLSEAETLLEPLRQEAGERKWISLHGNALELSAQLEIKKRNWESARSLLNLAESELSGKGGIEAFFVRKWKAVIELFAGDVNAHTDLEPIFRIRAEARNFFHWESMRDCDLFVAKRTHSVSHWLHLYYGSPFDAYRQRIFREIEVPLEIPDYYDWQIGVGTGPPLDLACLILEESKLVGGVMEALTDDFYRPVRIASLHRRLYDGEYYNPESSPNRVHQAIRVVRDWIVRKKLPLEIKHSPRGYSLSGENIVLRKPRQGIGRKSLDWVEILRRQCPSPFTSRGACGALGMPHRTATRLLQRAVEEGRLFRKGAGKNTSYEFVDKDGSPKPALRSSGKR